MFCDIHRLDGEPFEGDPRYVLKRNLERAREKGFTFYAGPEMEFFYFKSSTRPRAARPRPAYFDLTQLDMVSELRKQTILTLEAMGIPVEYSYHELGPSQHEIDLRYTDALTMADNVMTFRLVVKEVAQDLGVYATFMPKPIAGAFGSGMHTHLSLFEGDVNAFHDPGDEYGLSKVGKCFIAGLLRHARGDHRGHQPVGELLQAARSSATRRPVYVCWARNNRSALVRVPLPKKGKEELDADRVPLARPGLQPVPRVQRDARGRPQGHRGGLRAPARGHQQHLRDDPGGARGRGHRLPAPARSPRPST